MNPHTSPDTSALFIALKQVAREVSRDALPEFVAELEAAKAIALLRLVVPPVAMSVAAQALLTARQMAAQLNVPESWLRDRARQGKIPCVRLGHYVRFDPARVLEKLTNRKGS